MEFQHIISGYRSPCDDIATSLRSMLTMHNETVNAWTMVFGVTLLSVLTALHNAPNALHWMQLAALWIHLPLSFMYHTFSCSPKYSLVFRNMDITGVLIASFILTLTLSTLVFGIHNWITYTLCAIMICIISYDNRKYFNHTLHTNIEKDHRTSTTITLALGVVMYNIPVLALLFGSSTPPFVRTMCIFEIIAVSLAAVVYVTGFPESRYPKTFDLIGNSHNIAHTLLIIQQVAIWMIITHMTSS